MATWYCSPSGPLGTGSGNSAANAMALSKGLSASTGPVVAGDILILLGGTYTGKFTSTLNGTAIAPITVCSGKSDGTPVRWPTLPNGSANPDWAILDGYWTATLATSINATDQTVVLTSDVGFPAGTDVFIPSATGEQMHLTNTSNGITFTSVQRGWSGTTATSHTAGDLMFVAGTKGTLDISGGGDYVYFRDFEITNSNPTRVCNVDLPVKQIRGPGIFLHVGDHSKFINLFLHDGQEGMYISVSATNTEIYGDIIYNGGYEDWRRGHGQGLYMANDTGQKQIRNVISFNSFTDGMKAYAESGAVKNFLFEHIISFNNGVLESFPGNIAGGGGSALPANTRDGNLFAGTGSSLEPLTNLLYHGNYLYHPFDTKPEGGNQSIGYQGRNSTGIEVTDSRIMGGNNALGLTKIVGLTMTGNKMYAQTTSVGVVFNMVVNANLETGYTGTVNNNVYNSQITWAFPTYSFKFSVNGVPKQACGGGAPLTFSEVCGGGQGGWIQHTGFDLTGSTFANATPSGDEVFVIPNEYEIGRAHVACYNWSHASTVSVNLSTVGLVEGQTWYAYAAENPLGAPIATGTYAAATPSVSISTAGTTVAAPIGYNASIANGGMGGFIPATMRPEFMALIIVPGAQAAGPPDTPTGLSTNLGTSAGVILSYTVPASGAAATGVTVERSTDGVSYSALTTSAPFTAGAQTYTDSTVAAKAFYYYRISSQNGAGSSIYVGPVTSFTPVVLGYCPTGPNCSR